MPETVLPNLGIKYEYDLGAADWKNGYDANQVILDTLAQGHVLNDALLAEPGAPSVGDTYILPTGVKTGTNWGSDAGAVTDAVALHTNIPGQPDSSPWLYLTPREGWMVYERTSNHYMTFLGGVWVINGHLSRRVFETGDTSGDFEPDLQHANALVIFDAAFDEANDNLNIPDFATIAYPLGTTIDFLNDSGDVVNITDDAAISYTQGSRDPVVDGLPNGARVRFKNLGSDNWFVEYFNESGQHSTILNGFAADPTMEIDWAREGLIVTLTFSTETGTSDATNMDTATALPAKLRPTTTQIGLARIEENSAKAFGLVEIDSAGIATFRPDAASSAFTASSTKGVDKFSFSYPLL